jgi:hypothetical protein
MKPHDIKPADVLSLGSCELLVELAAMRCSGLWS